MPCDVMKVRGERVGDVILSRASEVFFFFYWQFKLGQVYCKSTQSSSGDICYNKMTPLERKMRKSVLKSNIRANDRRTTCVSVSISQNLLLC